MSSPALARSQRCYRLDSPCGTLMTRLRWLIGFALAGHWCGAIHVEHEPDRRYRVRRTARLTALPSSTTPPSHANLSSTPAIAAREEQWPMTIMPPPGWWFLHPPEHTHFALIDGAFGVAPDSSIVLTFTDKPSSTGVRIAQGTVGASGSAYDSVQTVELSETGHLRYWDCTVGWAAKPSKTVKLSLMQSPTRRLETDGDAYAACMTDPPTVKASGPSSPLPSASTPSSQPFPPAPSSLKSPPPASPAPQSDSRDIASIVPPPNNPPSTHPPLPTATPSTPSAPHPAAPATAIVSTGPTGNKPPHSVPVSSGTPVKSQNIGNTATPTQMDDTYQGEVWIDLPSPTVSVHPLAPQVGDWDAAGPFAHRFSFHAWVPTYLNETFDVFTNNPPDRPAWTSATRCVIGISSKPTGKETATFTIKGALPWVSPSGSVDGAYVHC
ncbi:hypothetical protein DB88DRAFT_117874 [Papiliotrema laurentii]|uniref:Uncharacterized protein n=1 Tax=Papiliotrema laurentii TaxID=5418 RepID=A0AAD9FPV5_PAPLA|nr:hypothetical protein DB88DRAFT_117874 [Papiliotrema laurentii]